VASTRRANTGVNLPRVPRVNPPRVPCRHQREQTPRGLTVELTSLWWQTAKGLTLELTVPASRFHPLAFKRTPGSFRRIPGSLEPDPGVLKKDPGVLLNDLHALLYGADEAPPSEGARRGAEGLQTRPSRLAGARAASQRRLITGAQPLPGAQSPRCRATWTLLLRLSANT